MYPLTIHSSQEYQETPFVTTVFQGKSQQSERRHSRRLLSPSKGHVHFVTVDVYTKPAIFVHFGVQSFGFK